MEYIKKAFKAEFIAVFLLLLVLIGLFFVPPSMGVADNGDFERVMSSVGLAYSEVDANQSYFFDYSQPVLRLENIFLWGSGLYATTHIIPIRIARVVNRIFYSQESFHMLCLAVVYSFFLLLAIYYIIKNLKTRNKLFNAFLVLVCVWVFGDATNLVYFNSLYGEACSYVFLLLMLGFGLEMIRSGFKTKKIIWFFVAAAMFFGSKLQYTLFSPLLFMIALAMLIQHRNTKVVSLCLGITIALSCLIYGIAPSQLGKDTLYNSVFYGVLRNSPNVEKDLAELGLPSYMEPLAGTHAYETIEAIDVKGEQFKQDFYEKTGRGKVMKFYLTHLDRLMDKMELTADFAYDNQLGMMGNYKIEDAAEPHQRNQWFTSYNAVKKEIYPNHFWFLILFYIVYFAYLVVSMLQKKDTEAFYKKLLLLMILLVGVLQFPLPIIGNGEADITKQLFIFNATFDIAVLSAVYALLKKVWIRKQRD